MKKVFAVAILVIIGVIVFGKKTAVQSLAPIPTITLSAIPQTIVQGDPVLITLVHATTTENIESANVVNPDGSLSPLHFAMYKSQLVAFYGSSISEKVGSAHVQVTFKDKTSLATSFAITKRFQPSENLPVPPQLGGNSTSSQQALVTNLKAENALLAALHSNPTTAYWTGAFTFPIKDPIVVTDPYGYNRDSGAETIIHKGTDFKAPPGTPVYAINNGVVQVAKAFTIYGNTVIIDHGVGIQSFYMHLLQTSVAAGQTITKGELIGYSGETGYAEGPHLHLTIRINGESIDPMKFFKLF